MNARSIHQTEAAEGKKIELVGRGEGEQEFYVEGIHGMNVSGPVLKMNFYTLAIDSSPANQRRESVCRIVMGLPQFFQMAQFFAQLSAKMREEAQQNKAVENKAGDAAPDSEK